MKRGTRHQPETQALMFSVFQGGLNLRSAPENISDNQLADCMNMTYSTQPGRLRTREGTGTPVWSFPNKVEGMCWYKEGLVVVSGGKLYRTQDHGVYQEIGSVTGNRKPSFCEFGKLLLIATGGRLQSFDGEVLSTLSDNFDSVVGLYARSGRVFCWETGSDVLHGSAVGDPTRWTVPVNQTDADPCEVSIGYKVEGNIINCTPLLDEVIVFKESAVFRLQGEYPNWAIKEVTRDEKIANQFSAVEVAGFLYYVERSKGARMLQATEGYNEIAPGDTLVDVNPWIRMFGDPYSCRLWHLPARNIILLSAGSAAVLPSYYEFGLSSMPTLKWKFYGLLNDVVEVNRNHLYLAIDKYIHDMNGESLYDWNPTDGITLPECSLSTKTYLPLNDYLVKRVMVIGSALDEVADDDPVTISLGGEEILEMEFHRSDAPFIYEVSKEVVSNSDDLFATYWQENIFEMHNPVRLDDIQLHMDGSKCPFELSQIKIEFVQIGVNT